MAEIKNFNVGIIFVNEGGTSCVEQYPLGQLTEKLQKHFKLSTILKRNIEKNSLILQLIIEQWTKYKEVDLILIFGNIELPSTNRILQENFPKCLEEFKHLNELLVKIQEEEIKNQVPSKCECYIVCDTLVLKQNISLRNYEGFFQNICCNLQVALKELKSSTVPLFPLTSKITESVYDLKSNVQPFTSAERPRQSIFPMISVAEAVECVLKETKVLDVIQINITDCLTFVLAEDVFASEPYPPFTASIKDGYAVIANDDSIIRSVIGVVTPGCTLDFDIKPGTCVRVSTGSAIPDKADAVIQVEDTIVSEKDSQGNEVKIKILKPAQHLQDIRTIGSDVSVGEILLPAKKKISAAEIGILAICGIQKLSVFKKPRIALLSTGDEVVEPHMPLKPGCIRDTNKSSLISLLLENRIPFIDIGIAKDTTDAIKSHLIAAMESADIIITTGSVSMGEKDLLKLVLVQDFEAVLHFGRVHMKPGKPTTFSTVNYKGKEKLIFSLPGNPVSAYVCFYLFVIPCIKKMMGYEEPKHTVLKVEIGHDIKLDERPEFYRVSLKPGKNSSFIAFSTGKQQSSRLLSMQNADALLILPPKTSEISSLKSGSVVDAILLKSI